MTVFKTIKKLKIKILLLFKVCKENFKSFRNFLENFKTNINEFKISSAFEAH